MMFLFFVLKKKCWNKNEFVVIFYFSSLIRCMKYMEDECILKCNEYKLLLLKKKKFEISY